MLGTLKIEVPSWPLQQHCYGLDFPYPGQTREPPCAASACGSQSRLPTAFVWFLLVRPPFVEAFRLPTACVVTAADLSHLLPGWPLWHSRLRTSVRHS